MTQTIFFSWQADTPNDRGFLKNVLEKVCSVLSTDTGVDEALRDVEVDSDTQGEPGQPPIVQTIFKKIDASAVFVADMTFVGVRKDSRPMPNPNVLIEYGWALKELTHRRVIYVMNTAYGVPTRENLPFDLSHMRLPICYNIPEDCSPEVKAEEKKKLIATLSGAIRTSLSVVPALIAEPPTPFPLAHAMSDRARFRGPNQALGFEYDGIGEPSKEVFLSSHPAAIWLRIMPVKNPGRTWPAHEIKKHMIEGSQMQLIPFSNGAGGYGKLRSADGAGMYRAKSHSNDSNSVETDSVAFVFNTGEIWSVDTTTLKYSGDSLPFMEDIYSENLQSNARFLKILGIEPPYKWMVGMIGIKGRHYNYPVQNGYGRIGEGPVCASDYIISEGEYDGKSDTKEALMPFFKKIFDDCGLPRPDYLSRQ